MFNFFFRRPQILKLAMFLFPQTFEIRDQRANFGVVQFVAKWLHTHWLIGTQCIAYAVTNRFEKYAVRMMPRMPIVIVRRRRII